jgi:DNA topoisomerase-3
VAIVQDRSLKSPELTGEWEAKLREIERGRLAPRPFMDEIVRYTAEIIRSGDAAPIDPERLGNCPRCGRPVIAGHRGFGCSGWRDGCPFVLWRDYRGHPLSEDQIRELLQRRVLRQSLTIEGSGPVLLQLTDSGVLTEIPVPTGGGGPRPARGNKGGRRSTRPRKQPGAGGGEPPPSGSAESEPGEPKPRRAGRGRAHGGAGAGERARARSAGAAPRARVAGFGAVALGNCPVCGAQVVEQEKSYGCSAWRQGCRFAIWKTIAGKAIGARTAQALLKRGQSPLLRGFRSKAGKPFEARLKLEGGEVRFDFGAGDRPRRPPRSPDTV